MVLERLRGGILENVRRGGRLELGFLVNLKSAVGISSVVNLGFLVCHMGDVGSLGGRGRGVVGVWLTQGGDIASLWGSGVVGCLNVHAGGRFWELLGKLSTGYLLMPLFQSTGTTSASRTSATSVSKKTSSGRRCSAGNMSELRKVLIDKVSFITSSLRGCLCIYTATLACPLGSFVCVHVLLYTIYYVVFMYVCVHMDRIACIALCRHPVVWTGKNCCGQVEIWVDRYKREGTENVFQNHRYCQLCLRSEWKWCLMCVCTL